MITTKIPIAYGRVVRIENGRIYVRNGDVMDVYNAEYYRVPVEWGEQYGSIQGTDRVSAGAGSR